MSQTLLIMRGTKSQLLEHGALLSGEMGFCTDSKEVFIGDGTTNVSVGRVMSGAYAARPLAASSGRMYYVTTGEYIGRLYLDTGYDWANVNVLELSDLAGTLDDIKEGVSYGKVLKSELTNGHVSTVSDGTNTVTAVQIKSHIADPQLHHTINDQASGPADLWSAQKIENSIELARRGMEPQDSVINRSLTAPPANPTAKDRYIVGALPTGVWAGKANSIAEWSGVAWLFFVPDVGWTAYIDDEQKIYSWNGTAWVRTGGALQTITAGNGLTGGGQSDTVTIAVGAGNGIMVNATSIAARAGKGIIVNSNGIETNIDASSIVYDSTNDNKLMVAVVDGGTF